MGWGYWVLGSGLQGASRPPPAEALETGRGCPPPFRVPSHAGYYVSTHIDQDHYIGACSLFAHLELSELIPVKSLDVRRAQCREGSGGSPAHMSC